MSAKEKQATRSGICFSCAINEKAFDEVKQRVRQHGLSSLTQCKKTSDVQKVRLSWQSL